MKLLTRVREQVGVWKGVGIHRFSLVCTSNGLGERAACKVGLYARVDGIRLLPDVTSVEQWDDKEAVYDVYEEKERG
jgi:hypothetical protein